MSEKKQMPRRIFDEMVGAFREVFSSCGLVPKQTVMVVQNIATASYRFLETLGGVEPGMCKTLPVADPDIPPISKQKLDLITARCAMLLFKAGVVDICGNVQLDALRVLLLAIISENFKCTNITELEGVSHRLDLISVECLEDFAGFSGLSAEETKSFISETSKHWLPR